MRGMPDTAARAASPNSAKAALFPTHPTRPRRLLLPSAPPQMARQTLRGVRNEHCLADLVSDDAAMEALMASPDPPLYCLQQVQTRERLLRGEK